MSQTIDPLRRYYPAFADLRDKLGMKTVSSRGSSRSRWMVVLEAPGFSLTIGHDIVDWYLSVELQGRQGSCDLTRVLHQMNLWDNRLPDSKLARVFEDHLADVLAALQDDAFRRKLGLT